VTGNQALILLLLVATMALFIWGRWRHDIVALAALVACVVMGLVPGASAFSGFGHPAVITVACVLVLSYGMQSTGAVDVLARRVLPAEAGPMLAIAALTGLGAFLSAFVNNVGAMALLMPVAIQLAARHGLTPGKVLMPLSFGTILGGMTTLIGTPPNLIVSGFRAEAGLESFSMFDFTPVGLAVAAAGVLFVALVGWRLVPAREPQGAAGFETGSYLTEARVDEDSAAVGKSIQEVEGLFGDADAQVVGMVRNEFRVMAPNVSRVVQAGDILIIEADPEALSSVLSSAGLKLEESVPATSREESMDASTAGTGKSRDVAGSGEPEEEGGRRERRPAEVALQELVVMPTSTLIDRTASDVQIRTVFGLNLVAISRQGRRTIKRLRSTRIKAGDLLLMQGSPDGLAGFAAETGCVPLAQRSIRIPDKRKTLVATATMALAVAGAAFGLLPAAVSFTAGVVALLVLRVVPVRRVYDAIDWPVIVLLGALIPVAQAMESTGAADLVAQSLLELLAQGNAVVALALILVVSMTLSDFMNNAATAAVMCPIAISSAEQLGASPDSFLMAVAIGASCAFLTPIGHQNNTLILGPGGFRFGDYWRLGLPMELLVIGVSIPLLLVVWPL
jgi:di/tricarboxylate transporter